MCAKLYLLGFIALASNILLVVYLMVLMPYREQQDASNVRFLILLVSLSIFFLLSLIVSYKMETTSGRVIISCVTFLIIMVAMINSEVLINYINNSYRYHEPTARAPGNK